MNFSHNFGVQHSFGVDPSNDIYQQQPFNEFEQQHLQDAGSAMYSVNGAQAGQRMSCGDTKPRLTKEQHDLLESQYQKQQKPNTSTKRGFAESLNVSLEKVNNWFQNRRAKSKQDAKKQQGTVGIFNLNQPSDLSLTASDSDTSPAYASADYKQMMQHLAEDEPAEFEQTPVNIQSSGVPRTSTMQVNNYNLLQAMANDMMINPIDLNRRTLTQEQFDAFPPPEMMLNSGDLALLSQDPEMLNKVLAAYSVNNPQFQADQHHMPTEHTLAVPTATNPAMLSYHIPRMEEQVLSTTSSDWTGDSRSSSVSLAQSTDQDLGTSMSSQQSFGQWQPGTSVPIDYQRMSEEFEKAAQAQQLSENIMEQPIVWPMDDITRRDSSASLVQSMGNVGLQTPQPVQTATFKSPTPVSSLAARRQKQRPAPLGLASLRSQSYSGSNPASSPGQMPQQSITTVPQLRRIKSSNVVNGIANGRVQKNIAPPQRSPLSWTFHDALNSPQAIRHQSSHSGNLAPPTPMSPPEQSASEQLAQLHHFQQQQWQSASGPVMQQDSISETEAEHAIAFMPTSSQAPTFTSPPHTPMFKNQAQYFLPPQIIPGNLIMENTPPQSAPASQLCFSQNMFVPSPQHGPHLQHPQQFPMPPPPPIMPQPMQHYFNLPPQPPAMPAMLFTMPQDMPAGPQFTVTTSGPSPDMSIQYAQHGMPIVDAQGQIQMAMPSQLQFVQHKIPRPENQAPKAQPKFSPGGTQLVFAATPSDSPLQITSQVPKHSGGTTSDFFVHEYTPPQEVKRNASPRKPVDSGPKNYTFANQTPQHFEKASKKAANKDSNGSSPETAVSV